MGVRCRYVDVEFPAAKSREGNVRQRERKAASQDSLKVLFNGVIYVEKILSALAADYPFLFLSLHLHPEA